MAVLLHDDVAEPTVQPARAHQHLPVEVDAAADSVTADEEVDHVPRSPVHGQPASSAARRRVDASSETVASAISNAGGDPRLVDIDDTFTMDPTDLERKIGECTKAVMVVPMSGAAGELDRIVEVTRRHGLPLLEDVAQANGASGRRAGPRVPARRRRPALRQRPLAAAPGSGESHE